MFSKRVGWYDVPVVPGYDTVRREMSKGGEQCDACGVRDGVRLDKAAWLMLCEDFRACAGRTRNDDLAMLALDRSAA